MTDSIDKLFDGVLSATEDSKDDNNTQKFINNGVTENEQTKIENEEQETINKLEEQKRLNEEQRKIQEAKNQARIETEKAKAEAEKAKIEEEKRITQLRLEAEKEKRKQEIEEKAKRDAEERLNEINRKKQLEEKERLKREEAANKHTSIGNFLPNDISIIVNTSNEFIKLDDDTKEAIKKYFAEKNDNKLLAAILNEPVPKRKAFIAIVNAQGASDVDRAFFLMSLDDNLLDEIGQVLIKYNQSEVDLELIKSNKIEYCRSIEKTISSLGPENERHLNALLNIFKINN